MNISSTTKGNSVLLTRIGCFGAISKTSHVDFFNALPLQGRRFFGNGMFAILRFVIGVFGQKAFMVEIKRYIRFIATTVVLILGVIWNAHAQNTLGIFSDIAGDRTSAIPITMDTLAIVGQMTDQSDARMQASIYSAASKNEVDLDHPNDTYYYYIAEAMDGIIFYKKILNERALTIRK